MRIGEFHDSYVLFCDGACSGNPGPGGYGLIIVEKGERVLEMGGAASSTTNNRMELTALLAGLHEIFGGDRRLPIHVFSDSAYVLLGISKWIFGWKKRGWTTAEGGEVSNRELWEELDQLVNQLGRTRIKWHYVPGHEGVPGNERVDEIAVDFSKGGRPNLFAGEFADYTVKIFQIPEDTSLPERDPGSWNSTPKKPISYLSLLGQTVERHTTWEQCQSRVKGQSGAKFKKAMTEEEEDAILRSWGKSRKDIKK